MGSTTASPIAHAAMDPEQRKVRLQDVREQLRRIAELRQATDAGLARIHEKRARPPSDGQSAEKGGQDASKRAKTADGKPAGGAVAQPGRKRPLSPDGGGKTGPRPQARPASHQRPSQGSGQQPKAAGHSSSASSQGLPAALQPGGSAPLVRVHQQPPVAGQQMKGAGSSSAPPSSTPRPPSLDQHGGPLSPTPAQPSPTGSSSSTRFSWLPAASRPVAPVVRAGEGRKPSVSPAPRPQSSIATRPVEPGNADQPASATTVIKVEEREAPPPPATATSAAPRPTGPAPSLSSHVGKPARAEESGHVPPPVATTTRPQPQPPASTAGTAAITAPTAPRPVAPGSGPRPSTSMQAGKPASTPGARGGTSGSKPPAPRAMSSQPRASGPQSSTTTTAAAPGASRSVGPPTSGAPSSTMPVGQPAGASAARGSMSGSKPPASQATPSQPPAPRPQSSTTLTAAAPRPTSAPSPSQAGRPAARGIPSSKPPAPRPSSPQPPAPRPLPSSTTVTAVATPRPMRAALDPTAPSFKPSSAALLTGPLPRPPRPRGPSSGATAPLPGQAARGPSPVARRPAPQQQPRPMSPAPQPAPTAQTVRRVVRVVTVATPRPPPAPASQPGQASTKRVGGSSAQAGPPVKKNMKGKAQAKSSTQQSSSSSAPAVKAGAPATTRAPSLPALLYPGNLRAIQDTGPCHLAGQRVQQYMELYRDDLQGDIRTAVERFVREPCSGRWGLKPFLRLQPCLYVSLAADTQQAGGPSATGAALTNEAKAATGSKGPSDAPGRAAVGSGWDPHRVICPYDLHGTCNDEECPHQHLSRQGPSAASSKAPASSRPSAYKPLEPLPPFTLPLLSSHLPKSTATSSAPPPPTAPASPQRTRTIPEAMPSPSDFVPLRRTSSDGLGMSGTPGQGEDDGAARYFVPLANTPSSSIHQYGGASAEELEEKVTADPQDVEAWLALALRALMKGVQEAAASQPLTTAAGGAAILLLAASSTALTPSAVIQVLQLSTGHLRRAEEQLKTGGAPPSSSPLRPCLRILTRALDHSPSSSTLWLLYLHLHLLRPLSSSAKLSALSSAVKQIEPPSLPLYMLYEATCRQLVHDLISLTATYASSIDSVTATASADAAPVLTFLLIQRTQLLLHTGHPRAAAAWLAAALEVEPLDDGDVVEEDEYGPLRDFKTDKVTPWAILSLSPPHAALLWMAHLSMATLGDLPPCLPHLAAKSIDAWGAEVWSLALDWRRVPSLRTMLKADHGRRAHVATSIAALEVWLGPTRSRSQEGDKLGAIGPVLDWDLEVVKHCLLKTTSTSSAARLPSHHRFLAVPVHFSALAPLDEQQPPSSAEDQPACDAGRAAKALLQLRRWARSRQAGAPLVGGADMMVLVWRDALRVWDGKAGRKAVEAGDVDLSVEEELIEEAERMVGKAKDGGGDLTMRLLMLWQIRYAIGGAQAALPCIRFWLRQPPVRRLCLLERSQLYLEYLHLTLADRSRSESTPVDVLATCLRDLASPASPPALSSLADTVLWALHTSHVDMAHRSSLAETFLSSAVSLLPPQDGCRVADSLLERPALWDVLSPQASHRLSLPLARAVLTHATGKPSQAAELLHLRNALRNRLRALEDEDKHSAIPSGGGRTDPSAGAVAHVLCMCEVALQEYGRALHALERGLTLEPMSWPLWVALMRLEASFNTEDRGEQIGGALSYHPVRLPLVLRGDMSLSWLGACRLRAASQRLRSVSLQKSKRSSSTDSSSTLVLDLSHALTIPVIPRSLLHLTTLTTLTLASNELQALPLSFARLASLSSLDLSHNKFSAIPSVVLNLPALRVLSMSSNPLAALPNDWLSLSGQLQELSLDSSCKGGTAKWSEETIRSKLMSLKVLRT